MELPATDDGQVQVRYKTRYEELPSFDLTGFTKIVESGGELYEEVRSDGRWEVLKSFAGEDRRIYGVASFDKHCPKGRYRYTVGVKASADDFNDTRLYEDLFSIHIRQSGWLIFMLEDFERQYGQFWQDDPYQLVKKLGCVFDASVGLHIDVYPPSYASDHDGMEFMMPVKRPASG